ncbi:MAG: tRNA 2-thiouridine(34) synthase MnmA [Lachnospiraceae bacterium]|nr:tRNA 2-thiouridine(34) synthase MnmA [Lachnospiraceae bacterium]
MPDKKKVVVGMSGGVDSSVAAYLLKENGYDVTGVTMQIWLDEGLYELSRADGCCSLSAVDDAEAVCKQIGIPHKVVNFKDVFREKVISDFIEEYRQGRTPNPCIVCNRYVKWESLLDWALENGADYIATGHYARVTRLDNGRYTITRSVTAAKDQTYALYNLTQEQLKHTLMPVGEYEKPEIREIAKRAGLPVSDKPDSEEICFIPDNDYAGFLERELGDSIPPEGNFVTADGEVLGRHKGITHYTIGQRRGLGLPMGHHVFVTEIRPETNEVVIGEGDEVFSSELCCGGLNFMSLGEDELRAGESKRLFGKIRYRHQGEWCTVYRSEMDRLEVKFDKPVRAVTPGQAAVFYDGDHIACGGTIEKRKKK